MRERERERESFIRNNLHNGVVTSTPHYNFIPGLTLPALPPPPSHPPPLLLLLLLRLHKSLYVCIFPINKHCGFDLITSMGPQITCCLYSSIPLIIHPHIPQAPGKHIPFRFRLGPPRMAAPRLSVLAGLTAVSPTGWCFGSVGVLAPRTMG